MTNERAIELLRRLQDEQFDGVHGDERREALSMAVRALEGDGDMVYRQQAIVTAIKAAIDWHRLANPQYSIAYCIGEAMRQLPSAQPEITEDDVKEFCRKRCLILVTSDFYHEMTRRWASAQPQRKKGKWIKISPANIYECSECGKNVMTDDISAYDFCHGCGADMRGESDETD